MTELSSEAQKAVQTAEKLMRLAGKNTNQHEAAAATAKAMELLAAYNLDVSIIEQSGGEKAARSDEKMAGGLYKYQRELWEAVADLNFCMYWNQYVFDKDKKRKHRDRWTGRSETRQGGYRFQHRVVGRKVNVVATRNMANYLEETIERLTRERLHGDTSQFFTAWAIAYREGIADEVIEKIYEERKRLLDADRRKQMEAEMKARAATKGKQSTATGLSLYTLAKSEEDANIDFLYGEGTSANWAKNRAEAAKKKKEADEAYAQWAAANPEEARKEEEKRRKESRRRSSWNAGTGRSAKERRYEEHSGAYWGGREAGKTVSLAPQTEGSSKDTKRLK